MVLAVGVIAVALRGDGSSAAAIARQAAEDDGRFGTTAEAAQTFLHISEVLATEAEHCDRDETRPRRECRSYFGAAAYARVASVGVVRCSRPELFDARQAMKGYLRQLEDDPAAATVPPPPRCT